MPRNAAKLPCGIAGCKAWAVHGSDPPRCSPHSGRAGAPPDNTNHLVHGYYTGVLHPDEASALASTMTASTIDAEILIVRAAVRRLFQMLTTGVTPGPDPKPLTAEDYARCTGLVFQGAGVVARLFRTRAQLVGDTKPFDDFMAQVLGDLGAEWGVQLT